MANRSEDIDKMPLPRASRALERFTAERTSDNLIFDKYDVGRVYQARLPITSGMRTFAAALAALAPPASRCRGC